jgi:hypothetical protein
MPTYRGTTQTPSGSKRIKASSGPGLKVGLTNPIVPRHPYMLPPCGKIASDIVRSEINESRE